MTDGVDGQPSALPSTGPSAVYEERAAVYDAEAVEKSSSVRVFSWLRLFVFLGLGVGVWFGATRGGVSWLAAVGALGGFIVLVALHRKARRRLRRVELMAEFNREGIARIDRRWDDLPTPPDLHVDPAHVSR